MFLSGGFTKENNLEENSTRAVYSLNLMSGNWKLFSELKSNRDRHQSTIISDKIYFVGGFNDSSLADTEVLPISNTDKILHLTIPTMHKERRNFGMCTFAGCMFVAGGKCNNNESLDKCEVYSTESCKWIEASSMNTKRRSFALIYFQEKIWAIGGVAPNRRCLNTIETYNLAENRWTTLDIKLLSKRRCHSAVVYNQKFFVVGGYYRNALSSVEVYSSETDQFSFVSSMSQARSFFGCNIFNNSLVVFGGCFKTSEITDSVEVYDIEKNVWSKGPNLPLPLVAFGCASNN